MELKPVRDFKFVATWYHSTDQREFEVEYLGGRIGIVWQRRDETWAWKRHNRSTYHGRYRNRIAAARALADEPVADPASRYPRKKRTRRKALSADRLLRMGSDDFWGKIEEELTIDYRNSTC